MATKKNEEKVTEEKVAEETAEEKVTEEKEYRTYKVLEDRNFNGFIHPKTRKFITEKDGLIKVSADDAQAIAILSSAADVTDITSVLK